MIKEIKEERERDYFDLANIYSYSVIMLSKYKIK